MDPTKDNLEDTLEELREALREIKTPEVTNTGAVSGSYGTDTITLGDFGAYNNNTVIGGGYSVNLGSMTHSNTGPYTVSTSAPGFTFSNPTTSITASSTMRTSLVSRFLLDGKMLMT
jgi:acetyltransferase-like isoleucine patch superfamily enzyme